MKEGQKTNQAGVNKSGRYFVNTTPDYLIILKNYTEYFYPYNEDTQREELQFTRDASGRRR